MVFIAEWASVAGATGVIVSVTLHQDARGAIAREGMGARFPRGVRVLIGRPFLQFQGKPRFQPRRRTISVMAMLEVSVSGK